MHGAHLNLVLKPHLLVPTRPAPPLPQTTANTLSYAIYCLAAHPDAQQKLLAELDALEGPRDREISVEDLQQVR